MSCVLKHRFCQLLPFEWNPTCHEGKCTCVGQFRHVNSVACHFLCHVSKPLLFWLIQSCGKIVTSFKFACIPRPPRGFLMSATCSRSIPWSLPSQKILLRTLWSHNGGHPTDAVTVRSWRSWAFWWCTKVQFSAAKVQFSAVKVHFSAVKVQFGAVKVQWLH